MDYIETKDLGKFIATTDLPVIREQLPRHTVMTSKERLDELERKAHRQAKQIEGLKVLLRASLKLLVESQSVSYSDSHKFNAVAKELESV